MTTGPQSTTRPRDGRESGDVLVVEDVVKNFALPRRGLRRKRDHVHSVDGVSIRVESGETLGLVGESGSGKSTLARIILRLIRPDRGAVRIDDTDVWSLRSGELKRLRRTAQLIFQDPHAAMDPKMTIGQSLVSVLAQHQIGDQVSRRRTALAALWDVELDESYLDRYPAECSGGQLQRVVIARALLLDPTVLVCDEPTSALDASVQAKILNLLRSLREHRGLTMMMISHDLRVVRCVSDRVAVMYLGQIVEIADRETLFERSHHPYTIALLVASERQAENTELVTGEPASPIDPPQGCRFHPRCPLAIDVCRTEPPPLSEITPGHAVRCHRADEARRLLPEPAIEAPR